MSGSTQDQTASGAPESRPAGEAAMLCQPQAGTGQAFVFVFFFFFLAVNISPQQTHGPGLAPYSGFVQSELSLENTGLKRPPPPLSVAAFQNADTAGMFISLTDCELRRKRV